MAWKHHPVSGLGVVEALKERFPISMHGVSLNLGSFDNLDLSYVRALKDLAQKVNPVRISDHLCWTGIQGRNSHDLLPLPYTEESLNHIADKLKILQHELQRQFLIENPSSYFEFPESSMDEAEFLTQLVSETGCGILLDLNNIFVTTQNLGGSANDYLRKIPSHAIEQIHLAGHTQTDRFLIDTHAADVNSQVWDLYQQSLDQFGIKPTMIERDDNFRPWSELMQELQHIERHQIEHLQRSSFASI